jgi:hypothetical protein
MPFAMLSISTNCSTCETGRPSVRSTAARAALYGILGVHLWVALASGESPEKATDKSVPVSEAAEESAPVTEPKLLPGEVGPELYLLKDKEGHLQAVPGFKFEDFIELYRIKNQLDRVEAEPRYVLSRLNLSGMVHGQLAKLSALLTIEVNDASWLRIPLGLSGAIVEEDAKLDGTGEVLVQYQDATKPDNADPNSREKTAAGGYILWLRGKPGETCKVTIPLIAPLTLVGGETQLRLEAPRATVAQLTLEVPIADAIGRVSDGATLGDPRHGSKSTTFSVLGATGPLELTWRAPSNTQTVAPTILEVAGMIMTRIDGRGVGSDAKLTVRSLGGPFDHFQVRLPPGSQLISKKQSGVMVTPVPGGPLVDVKLEKKTSGPIEVRLTTDRPRLPDNFDERIELAGFEVSGAVRQWGNLGVQVVGNWQVVWGESRGMRQVDEIPESLRNDDLVAMFEYTAQPSSLLAQVVPRRTRVSVQPQYVLNVGSQESRLAAEFKYTVRGAKVRALSLAMPGWEIDEIGPPGLVNVDAAAIENAEKFSIPLAQSANGDLTLTVTARRAMPSGPADAARLLELDLPRPQAEVIAPAVVVVQPDDNVELTPRSDALVGLSLRSSRPAVPLPVLQQDPLLYQADGANSKFVADITVHSRATTATVDSRVDLDEQEIRVDERLRFDIAYEPIDRIVLSAPRSIPLESLEVSFEGTKLSPSPMPAPVDNASRDTTLLAIPLSGSRIGRCELVVTFRLPQDRLLPATSVPITLPLVMPADATLKHNRLLVMAGTGLSISHRKGAWTVDERARAVTARQDGLWLSSDVATETVDLAVTLQDHAREASTLVERGWIQSWLTDRGRQDRVVLRLSTNERRLWLDLPEGAVPSAAEVRLDGQPVVLDVDSHGSLVLNVSPKEGSAHLLELAYHLPGQEPVGRLALSPPRLRPAVWSRRLYWQVMLPSHDHLILSPRGFTNELEWQWNGMLWQRVPTLDKQQLKQWIGVRDSTADVATKTSTYLFSTVGECPVMYVWTARRSTLVFAASLAVLVVGLGLMYLPVLRHPAALFVAAVLLIALGLCVPDLALVIAQAALLGGLLVALAMLLARWRTVEPVAPAVLPIERPSVDQSATDLYYRTTPSGSDSSTATAPLVLPVSQAESAP